MYEDLHHAYLPLSMDCGIWQSKCGTVKGYIQMVIDTKIF